MNIRQLPKRAQGFIIMLTGFVMTIIANALQLELLLVEIPKVGLYTLDQAVTLFGFTYMVGIGYGDQLRRSVQTKRTPTPSGASE